ncbi:methyltransferase domain-containing protein [Methylacidimicrobium tartarophylax]|uniref:Thiopurine S-methyltransferase n=1 Tax=Methylacidimicrobium tartarophylax TaxID=1041768 RepID=A0A5E6MJ89_9BACT|nr:methyltransferase domain-containing protein [Methylacidimicrobium tartarophylax]VVM06127.1 thiopurine S-methyltransferase [Methylacidimicrobium tartarophylax]
MSAAPLDDPAYWESRYRLGDAPWNRGMPSPALEESLLRFSRPGRVLVPGCGHGHDVRLLAKHGWEVVGIDFAPAALAEARSQEDHPRVEYQNADFLALPEKFSGAFDLVWEHTCFCAIPPERRPDYVRSVRRALKPGGKLLGIFFLATAPPEPPPHCFTLDELDLFFSSDFVVEAEWLPSCCYPGREGEEILRLLARKE